MNAFLDFRPGLKLAYRAEGGPAKPGQAGLMWLGGLRSDMTGSKA